MKKWISLHLLISIGLVFFYYSCKPEKSKHQGMDLMKYGIPYTIFAPDDVIATQIGGGQMVDLKLTNNTNYDIMIFMSRAQTKHMDRLKQFKKEEVSFYPGFIKIVEEYNEGFLYEMYGSTGNLSYGFFAVKIVGDQEISFISGAGRDYTEAETKAMLRTILY